MADAPKINLLGLTRSGMEAYFAELGAKPFHGRNVLKWIHKHGVTDFDAMTDVPQKLRDLLRVQAEIRVPEIVLSQPAGDGTTEHFFTVEFAEGRVSSVRRVSPDTIDPASAAEPPTEEVSFVFHNITWTYEPTGAMHHDNWRENQ